MLLIGWILFAGNVTEAQGIRTPKITLAELADKGAIRELVDAYAHDADRRDSLDQANLFTSDGIIEIYDSEPSPATKPVAILQGRKALKSAFSVLKNYDVTMHFNGQSDIKLHGDSATGETYCLAHQFWKDHDQRILMTIGIRYYDSFLKVNGSWYFAKRKLIFDWTDRRSSVPRLPGE